MEKSINVDVLMLDGCTRNEAHKHLNNGSIVFLEEDLKKHFDKYMEEWDIDEEKQERYKQMIDSKKPLEDWGIVEKDGKTYYIMYCL